MNIANYPEYLAYAKNKEARLCKEALKYRDGFLSTSKASLSLILEISAKWQKISNEDMGQSHLPVGCLCDWAACHTKTSNLSVRLSSTFTTVMKKQLSEMTLEELWHLFPIILKEYDEHWPLWYQEEEALLKAQFGRIIFRIRHIGSTSVPGMLAKPTVDILLESVPECPAETIRELARKSGYTVMAEAKEGTYQLDLCKGYTPDGFAEKVFHLHIRYPGDWDEPVFCDYLRRHPDCARQYADLKMKLKTRFEHDRDGYTAAKTDFIRFWTAKAREEPDMPSPHGISDARL